MNETLQEYVDSRGVEIRVDRDQGVIRGVKILGLESRNGRSYRPDALAKAARLYEGAKVNVNHPKGNPSGPRDYQDRIGVIRNVLVRPAEGLFADFHFNPKHALAEQLAWDAERAPENVGFSHNVLARTARQGDALVVEEIAKVQSVDLVADPATTRGLFEQAEGCRASFQLAPQESASLQLAPQQSASLQLAPRESGETISCEAALTADELRRSHPDLVEELLEEQSGRLSQLQAEVDRLTAAEALHEKQQTARRLLAEFGLPDADTAQGWARSAVSPRFLEALLAAPHEQAMRELVEDRAKLVHGAGSQQGLDRSVARPVSRDQHQVYGAAPADAKTFVEAIT